jgi:DNA-binding IclR family transcriptional regulator
MAMTPEQDRSLTPTDRALQLLVELVRDGGPLTAKELARRVELPPSTAYRHLETLRVWGLIGEAGRGDAIELGPTAMLIARHFDRPEHLLNLARPILHGLVLAADESVALMVAIGREAVCLEMVESSQPLRCSYATGRSQPLSRGASAKALLAFMAEPRCSAVLAVTVPEAAARQALLAELATIRRRGYAESEGEVDHAIWGVSAPIASPSGRIAAALTLMAPASRIRGRRDELVALTRAAAVRIDQALCGAAQERAA